MTKISHQSLTETLDYNPATGQFIWKVATSRRVKVGTVAGSVTSHGYIAIGLFGTAYYGQDLAWFYTYQAWPTSTVDHEDTDRSNNRIGNLRLATTSQNSQNSKQHSDNSSGFKGVRKYRKRYAARIRVNGENIHLGTFDLPEDAARSYDAAAIKNFGQFAQTNHSLGLIS